MNKRKEYFVEMEELHFRMIRHLVFAERALHSISETLRLIQAYLDELEAKYPVSARK